MNDLALLDHFNFLFVGEQQESNNSGNVDPFVLAREVVAGFEQRNIVFNDIELPAPEERLHPVIISVDVNDYPLLGVLVDTRASRSVCSLFTLDYLEMEEKEITRHHFTCAAYDRSQREAIKTVQMDITVGPLTSTTMVIIIEEDLVEPLILGRSWLAEIRALASLVHLKFKH